MHLHQIESWLVSCALAVCLVHFPDLACAQNRTDQAQTQLPTLPFLRMPHIDEGDLDVLDANGKSTVPVHFWVFASADPSVRTVYYLAQLIQLPAGQGRFMRDAEREHGKVWYSFWVGVPSGFDKIRRDHFKGNRERYALKDREQPNLSANVIPIDIESVSIIPEIAKPADKSRSTLLEFLVSVFVDADKAQVFDRDLEASSASLVYNILLPGSSAMKSHVVSFGCKKVATTLDLSLQAKFISLANVRLALNKSKEVTFGEFRNVPEQKTGEILGRVAEQCGFDAKPANSETAPGDKEKKKETDKDPPSLGDSKKMGWSMSLNSGYEANSEKHVDIEVQLEDSIVSHPLTVKLSGLVPSAARGIVRADSEQWQLIADIAKGQTYRITLSGKWQIAGKLAGEGACGWTGKLPSSLADKQFRFSKIVPFSVMLRFVPAKGPTKEFRNVCESSVLDFRAPQDGKLEGTFNGVEGEYSVNEGFVRATVRRRTANGVFEPVF